MKTDPETEIKWQVIRYDSLDSTNDEAFRLYEKQGNDCLPNIIIAKSQTAGKGQFDRTWESPEGNLYMSFSLSKSFLEWKLGERLDEAMFTLKIGELLHSAIRSYLEDEILGSTSIQEKEKTARGIESKLKIKEPNDILYGSKKLAGILVEVKGDLVVVGIGMNLNEDPINSSISIREILNETPPNKLSSEEAINIDVFADRFLTSMSEFAIL